MVNYCAAFGLRLPSFSEAVTLAEKYDVPGVSGSQFFWSDDAYFSGSDVALAFNENAGRSEDPFGSINQTVCVTDPSA